MKNLILIFTLMLSSTGLFGQINEGAATYKMDFESDNPEMEMAISMMAGSEMTLSFQETKTRVDVSMGTMMKMTTISDAESENLLMLMDVAMAGMKYGVKSSFNEIEELGEGEEPEMEVNLLDESKEILGYKCKKAVLMDGDGNESIFWYTEEIIANKKGQSYLNEDIPGFPLEYEIMQGDMKITLTASAFSDSIDKKEAKTLFSLDIPEGYEEKTFEEIQSMGM